MDQSTTAEWRNSTALAVVVAVALLAALAIPGIAAASHDTDYDETLEDGEYYWQGQDLYRSANISADEVVELRQDDGDYWRQHQANADGEIIIETSNLNVGDYTLLTESGDEVASFEVVEQTLAVSVDEDSVVNNGEVGETSATFTFDSNRVNYDIYITAGDHDAETVAAAFEDAHADSLSIHENADGEQVVLIEDADGDLTADFDGLKDGAYGFEFTVVDTEVSTSESVSVTDPGDAHATFDVTDQTVPGGDTMTFTVNLDATKTAVVTFGDQENIGYEYNFAVYDGNTDGEVTVEFDTPVAGTESVPFTAVSEGDEVRHPDGESPPAADQDLPRSLVPYTYPLEVAVNGEMTDVDALIIQERQSMSANTHIAPADDIDTRDHVTQRDTVAEGDALIIEVAANGIYSALDEDNTAADLVEGSTFAQEHGIYMHIEESNVHDWMTPNELDVSKAELVVEPEEERFFLVFDSSDLNAEVDDTYEVSFNMTEDHPYVFEDTSDQNLTTEFTLVEADVTFKTDDQDRVEVQETTASDEDADGTPAEFGVTTTLAPGTEFTATLQGHGDSPFLTSDTITVDEAGEATAVVSLPEFTDEESDITASLRGHIDEHEAVYLPANPTHEVSIKVTGEDGEAIPATVTLDGVTRTVDDGLAQFEDIGSGEYEAVVEADGYESDVFTVSVGADASNEHTVSLPAVEEEADEPEEEEPEETEETENEPEETEETETDEEPESEETESTEGDDEQSSSGQPGFGIAVALVALLAAAALAQRREA